MRKFPAFIALLLAVLLTVTAGFAAQARFFREDQDQSYHSGHLALHLGSNNCKASGNSLKVRTEPGGKSVQGHLGVADIFTLEEISGHWAKISVVYPAADSSDSYAGLTGWVDADYIECPCSENEYRTNTPSLTYSLAETVNKSTAIRERADKSSGALTKLKKGEQVEVISEYTGSDKKVWYRVRYDGRIMGYIRSDLVSITASGLPEQLAGRETEDAAEMEAEEPDYDPFSQYPAPTEEELVWRNLYWDFSGVLIQSIYDSEDTASEIADPFGNLYYKDSTIMTGLYDLNRDGTPEFLASEGFIPDSGVNCVYVYTIADGQVQYAGSAPTRISEPYSTGSRDYPGFLTIHGNMGVVDVEYFTLDENGKLVGELIYESDANDPNDPEGSLDTPKITAYTLDPTLYVIARSGKSGSAVLTTPLDELSIDPVWPGFMHKWKEIY